MILELNKKNIESLELEKQGYSKEDNNQLINRKTNISLNDVYFDYENMKIHTGIDMAKYFLNKESDYKRFPFNYPDLITEYYTIKLEKFLNDKKRLLGTIYNEPEQIKEFINEQIKETQIIIDENKSKELRHSLNSRKNNISVHKGYVFFLKQRLNELTKQNNQSYLFKQKYQSDNWHKYENESILFKTSTEKINYWSNKLLEYQKDKINLDYLGTAMLTLDVNLKEPKHLNGFLFDKFCQKNIDLLKLENQTYKPQQIENKKPDEVNNNSYQLIENNFDNVEPQKVIKHFNKLVESGYITQSDFNSFIENRFYLNKNVSIKIDILKENSKGKVKKIFYTYYDSIQPDKYSNLEKYLKLLTENFSGFNYVSLKTNFSK